MEGPNVKEVAVEDQREFIRTPPSHRQAGKRPLISSTTDNHY